MTFSNLSRFAAIDTPIVDPVGRDLALVVVKGTFELDGTRAVKQVPVRLADEPWAPERETENSIRWPSDRVIAKRGADVVVVGAACSASEVRCVDVLVRAGARRVHLRVHGERVFYRGAGGRVVVGQAAPFVQKPIVYELAYGGTSADGMAVEARNPVGRGMASRDEDLIDTQAPQIELAEAPYKGVGDRHAPAGLGAICSSWAPRASFAGTFDATWEAERMPLMPENFDVRYNNCAHPLLQLDAPLAAGMPVGVDGMSLHGPIALSVPELAVIVTGLFDDATATTLRPVVDTLVIDTETRRFEVSARASFAVGRGGRRLRALRVEHG